MSLLLGDTGKSQIGPLKTFTITPGVARETLLGTPLTLPTTEPTTAQVAFTVQLSDLPIISPNVAIKYNASLVCSGKIGAVATILNYRVLKNGVSIAQSSGASATATQFWANIHWRTFDVQVGDILEVKYWSNQTDTTLDFYGLMIYPSQPDVTKRGNMLKDVTFSNIVSNSPFTTAFTVTNSGNYCVYPTSSNTINLGHGVGTTSYPVLNTNISYGLFRNIYGEVNGGASTQNINATQRQLQNLYIPTTISFREVLR